MNEISRDRLVAVIQDIVTNGESGSILLKDQNQHSAIIAIDNGTIISISYGVKRGMRALPHLQKIESCTYRINDMILGRPIANLLPTDELLNAIKHAGTIPKTTLYKVAPTGSFNAPQALGILKEHLTQIIGPVAQIILDDELEDMDEVKTLEHFKILLKRVAKEALDKDEAFTFSSDILDKL